MSVEFGKCDIIEVIEKGGLNFDLEICVTDIKECVLNIDIEVFVLDFGKCALNTELELFVVSFRVGGRVHRLRRREWARAQP